MRQQQEVDNEMELGLDSDLGGEMDQEESTASPDDSEQEQMNEMRGIREEYRKLITTTEGVACRSATKERCTLQRQNSFSKSLTSFLCTPQ